MPNLVGTMGLMGTTGLTGVTGNEIQNHSYQLEFQINDILIKLSQQRDEWLIFLNEIYSIEPQSRSSIEFLVKIKESQKLINESNEFIQVFQTNDIFISQFDIIMNIGELLTELEAIMESVNRIRTCKTIDEHILNCVSRLNHLLQNQHMATKPQVTECFRDAQSVVKFTNSNNLNELINRLKNTFPYLSTLPQVQQSLQSETKNQTTQTLEQFVNQIISQWDECDKLESLKTLKTLQSSQSTPLFDLLSVLLTSTPDEILSFCRKFIDNQVSDDLFQKLSNFIFKKFRTQSLYTQFEDVLYELNRLKQTCTFGEDISNRVSEIENTFKVCLSKFTSVSSDLSCSDKHDIKIMIGKIELFLEQYPTKTEEPKLNSSIPDDTIVENLSPETDNNVSCYVDEPNRIYNLLFKNSNNLQTEDLEFCPYCMTQSDDVQIVLRLVQFRKGDPIYFHVANYAGEPHYLVNQSNIPIEIEWPTKNAPNLSNPVPVLPTVDFDVPLICQHLCQNLNIRVTTEGNLAKVILNDQKVPIENEPFYISPTFPDNVDRKLSPDEEFFVVRVKQSSFGKVYLSPIPKFRSLGIILEPNFDFSVVKQFEKKLKPIVAQSPKCAACFLPPFYLSRLSLPDGPIWLTVYDYQTKSFRHIVDMKREPVKILLSNEAIDIHFQTNKHHSHLRLRTFHERRCLRLDNQFDCISNLLPSMEAQIASKDKNDQPNCKITSKYFEFSDFGMLIGRCHDGLLSLGDISVVIPFQIPDCDKCQRFYNYYPMLHLNGPPLTLVSKHLYHCTYYLEIQFKTHSQKLYDSNGNLLIFEDYESLITPSFKHFSHFSKKGIKIKCGHMNSCKEWVYSKALSYSHLCEHIVNLMNLHIDNNKHLTLTWPLSENSCHIYFYQPQHPKNTTICQSVTKLNHNDDYKNLSFRKKPIILTHNCPGPVKFQI